MKPLGGLIAAALFCIPSMVRADDAPLRTMVYHFAYDSRHFGGSPTASQYGAVSENGTADMAGRTGEIEVKVVKATPDGGMVADVTETISNSLEPAQTVRCAVYGASGDVICDQNFHASNEERVLLTYVGRFFYDPSKLDAEHHWRAAPSIMRGAVTVTSDYAVKKTDGDLLTIGVERKEEGLGYQATTTGTVVYDAKMELPESIHLSTSAVNSGNQGDANVDLTLKSDSMAAGATSQTSH